VSRFSCSGVKCTSIYLRVLENGLASNGAEFCLCIERRSASSLDPACRLVRDTLKYLGDKAECVALVLRDNEMPFNGDF